MTGTRLPIEGYPHLSLAAQPDTHLFERTLVGLRAAGFKVEADRIVPPAGARGQDVIAAISYAFQEAKRKKG